MSGIIEQNAITYLNIAVSASTIVVGLVALIRYLKKARLKDVETLRGQLVENREQTRKQLDVNAEEAKKEIKMLMERIQIERNVTNQSLSHNLQRIDEIKEMMKLIEKTLTQRIDYRVEEIKVLGIKLDELRVELNKLNVEVARKMAAHVETTNRHRREDRDERYNERRMDRDFIDDENSRRQEYEGDVG